MIIYYKCMLLKKIPLKNRKIVRNNFKKIKLNNIVHQN